MRVKQWLPNGLTLFGIMISGIAIIHYNHFWVAATVIPINACIDWFDGYYARKINAESTFGRYLDFVNDSIGFIILPIVMTMPFVDESRLWVFIVLSTLFFSAGVFRLARELARPDNSYFTGLPTTAAAIIFLIVKLMNINLLNAFISSTLVLFATMIVLMVLMVSPIKFYRILQKKSC